MKTLGRTWTGLLAFLAAATLLLGAMGCQEPTAPTAEEQPSDTSSTEKESDEHPTEEKPADEHPTEEKESAEHPE